MHFFNFVLQLLLVRCCWSKLSRKSEDGLILTHYITSGKVEEAQKLARITDPQFHGIESYAGYLTTHKETGTQTFFWHFPANSDPNAPLVVWLPGNLGQSVMFDVLNGFGPYVLQSDGTLKVREDSWHRFFNLLVLEAQPGVGFSRTHEMNAKNLAGIDEGIYEALQQFRELFPELAAREVFFASEAFGNQYAISAAYLIISKNQLVEADKQINLKGLIAMSAVFDISKQSNFADYWYQLGLVDDAQRDVLRAEETILQRLLGKNESDQAAQQYARITFASDSLYTNFTGLQQSVDYLRTFQVSASPLMIYLNEEQVQAGLHADRLQISERSEQAVALLLPTLTRSVSERLIEVLAHCRILSLNGGLDPITPYVFMDNYWNTLNTTRLAAYSNTTKTALTIGNDAIGHVKTLTNLTQAFIMNATRTLIQSQPKWLHHIVYNFVYGAS